MRFDIHIHTKYSYDCRSPVKKVMKTTKSKGMDGLAITDHNEIRGYSKAKPWARRLGLKLIPGYELKTKQGDILILGTTELLEPFKPVEESIEEAHELGALVIAAHPFDPFRAGVGDLIDDLDLDAVEVANSHCVKNSEAKKAAVRNELPQTGGSDAHICREIGNAYTLCDEEPLKAIRKGACSAQGGLHVTSIPLAIAYGALTITGRVRERVKRWRS